MNIHNEKTPDKRGGTLNFVLVRDLRRWDFFYLLTTFQLYKRPLKQNVWYHECMYIYHNVSLTSAHILVLVLENRPTHGHHMFNRRPGTGLLCMLKYLQSQTDSTAMFFVAYYSKVYHCFYSLYFNRLLRRVASLVQAK